MTETTTSPQQATTSGAAQPAPGAPPAVEPEPLTPGLHSRYYTDPACSPSSRSGSSPGPGRSSAHESDVPNPGSRVVGKLGTTEVVVVRTETGEIRAHVNTCRHRGTRLVAEPGEEKALRCPYHGWTYHLDGELVGAPGGPRRSPAWTSRSWALFPARVEVFCGLVFANLDPDAEPLAPQLEGIRPLLERYLSGTLEQFSDYRLHARRPEGRAGRRTGRSSSTTTSRATTCRSPTPA